MTSTEKRFGLGRKVEHDPRSLAFPVAGLPMSSLKSVRWTRRCPVLDQGNLGSCTGNAAAGWLGTDNTWRQGIESIRETDAVALYSQATHLDQDKSEAYPPIDCGSSSLGIAKALKAKNEVSAYHHAFSLQATLTALQSGPVPIGISWHEASFKPAKDGRLSIAGDVAGGHEILLDEINVDHKTVALTNSWGASWGIDGRAYFTWDDLGTLLDDQGDAIRLTPKIAA